MNIFFYLVPFITTLLVLFTKRKIVNQKNGKKYAKREICIDVAKFLVIYSLTISEYILLSKNIPLTALIIDLLMLAAYLIPFVQKNYNFAERKAFMGILASSVIIFILLITMFQMIIGTYNVNDASLFFNFVKGVIYLFIAIWCCLTVDNNHKFKSFFKGLIEIFKNYRCSKQDYLCFGFLALFLYTGINNTFTPVGVFGIHDLLKNKKTKKQKASSSSLQETSFYF